MESVAAELLKGLLATGPGGLVAAFAFYNWREERAERRELQSQNVQLLRDKITSDNAMAVALDKLAERVNP